MIEMITKILVIKIIDIIETIKIMTFKIFDNKELTLLLLWKNLYIFIIPYPL